MRQQLIMDKMGCYFLLLSVVLYNSQGVLIPLFLGQVFLMLIILISFFYIFKLALTRTRFPKIMVPWSLFICMNIVGFILYNDLSEFEILKGVLLNFLPFFAFYYFAEKKILTSNLLVLVFLIFLPVFIIKFNQTLLELILQKNRLEVVNNTVYLFIGLLPFPFLFKKKAFALIALLILWYFMVQSAKRGAIVCGGIAIMLFVIQNLYNSKGKIGVKQYVLSISLFLIITYFGYNFYQKNQFLIGRMENMISGNSSGRDSLINSILGAWYNSENLFHYLFGLGYNSSRIASGMGSHNDWVDILASFGIVGLLVYLAIYKEFVVQIFQKGWARDKRIVLILVFCIAIITSLTSRWYSSTFSYMQILIIPYIIAHRPKGNLK